MIKNDSGKLLLIEKVLILKSLSIFAETPENILAEVAPLMNEIELGSDSLIFNEGEAGDSMYIIFEGEVKIHKGRTTLAVLKKKGFFWRTFLIRFGNKVGKCHDDQRLHAFQN